MGVSLIVISLVVSEKKRGRNPPPPEYKVSKKSPSTSRVTDLAREMSGSSGNVQAFIS